MERFIKIIDEIVELHAELAEKSAHIAELEDKLRAANRTIKHQACVLEGVKLIFGSNKRGTL